MYFSACLLQAVLAGLLWFQLCEDGMNKIFLKSKFSGKSSYIHIHVVRSSFLYTVYVILGTNRILQV